MTTLEADGKTTKAGIARIELSIVRIEETLKHLATKADFADVKEAVNTLDVKASALDVRVGRVEINISTALTTAVSKAIAPWQLPVIVGASAAALAAIATGYAWLSHQPWFPH